ncbi:MAG TPA: Ltp family lipoprotein [Firmicutes bacterium]|nr:Ltp family lipoprotein [Bacillota bacterium]
MEKILFLLVTGVLFLTACTDEVVEQQPNQQEEQQIKEDEQNPSNMTKGQENALASAKNYLEFSPFSYDGLIKQLEFEQYSHEDAVFAADNCGADWNEQAVKAAQNYLDTMSFSRDALIDQLKFEGFTDQQATYGVDKVGL